MQVCERTSRKTVKERNGGRKPREKRQEKIERKFKKIREKTNEKI